ncbi:MAG: amidohydrolase family protein, partial [bacterium]
DGRAMSKILQGVTTEVVGQDGGSVAPLNSAMYEENRAASQKRYGLAADWRDFSGYFENIRRQGVSVNLMSMVGTGTLREHVIGFDNRPATAAEIAQMQSLIRQSLEQGARHLSSGLEYTPGSFASTDELARLASVLGPGGIYSSHIRNEDDHLETAIAEAISIAKNGNCGVNISHLKAQGQRNWHKLDSVFAMLEGARKDGLRATCDRYPYVAYSTGLSNLFPIWAKEGGTEKFVERLQAQENGERIRKYVLDKVSALGSWDSVLISSLSGDENQKYVGRRLGELALEVGREPYNLLLEIVLSQNGGGGMVGFGMSEENTKRILAHPYAVVASDGSARTVDGILGGGSPHPRNYGTFPRVLGHYVREQKTLSLQEAIRKMTALPASIVGISHRGTLAEGFRADVTVFDPDTVIDRATFAEPKQYPQSIEHVIVNGKMVVQDGEHTGAKPGMVI